MPKPCRSRCSPTAPSMPSCAATGKRRRTSSSTGRPFAEILGLSYRESNERVVHNPPRPVQMELDAYPMPAYHLIDFKHYFPAVGTYRNLPAMNALMTRGCPGKCTFCNSAFTTLRSHSAEQMVERIKHLAPEYGIRQIQFYDDTFTVAKPRVDRVLPADDRRPGRRDLDCLHPRRLFLGRDRPADEGRRMPPGPGRHRERRRRHHAQHRQAHREGPLPQGRPHRARARHRGSRLVHHRQRRRNVADDAGEPGFRQGTGPRSVPAEHQHALPGHAAL